MRWPQNAVSLVGRAGALSPGKTYKLMRALRKHAARLPRPAVDADERENIDNKQAPKS